MSALETAAAAAAKAVTQRAVQEWLSARSATAERNADLSALVRSRLPDRLVRRSFERQVEAIADGVDRRLTALVEREYGGLSENDRAAALREAVDTLQRADFSDRAVLDAQADPILLTERIRQGLPDQCRQLGEAGARLYDVLLRDLTPLADHEELRFLSIQRTAVNDLTPLTNLTKLRGLNLRGTASTLDVAPFAGMRNLLIFADKTQEFLNVRALHRNVTIIRS